MLKTEDTIIAIATATSDAGIGILRLSGAGALRCADKCLTDAKGSHTLLSRKAGTIAFMRVCSKEGRVMDEALVSVMRSPHSYTGEDVVEINLHGSRLLMEKVLRLLLSENERVLRLAEPGEFTKRAFLNGKMDLSQAEAVQDLIHAQNDFAAANAIKQLTGFLRNRIEELRSQILQETAFLEAALDDPDNYDLAGFRETLPVKLSNIIQGIEELLQNAEEGRIRKEGLRVVITGEPNVGKSTLLNLLSGEEKAIVTDVPGTTRDILNEQVRLNDLLLNLSDTAGIRASTDQVEQIGVTRALNKAGEADLILAVFDMEKLYRREAISKDLRKLLPQKKCLLLVNKTDLLSESKQAQALAFLKEELGEIKHPILCTSFLRGEGRQDLEKQIYDMFLNGEVVPKEEFMLTNLRHSQALLAAKSSLHFVLQACKDSVSEDVFTVDLMEAYAQLSLIIGEEIEDDLADKIFAEFCMGK